MKKQYIKAGSFVILLIVCVIGYFLITNYYDGKEQEEENKNKIIAFSLDNYKDTKSVSYTSDSGKIKLVRGGEQWKIEGESKIDVDESVVETDMLSLLVEVAADDKIENPSNLEEYGFIKKDGKITESTNTITLTDSENKEHIIYIGSANPYDASKYYMMVEGDGNVYVIDSSIADAFTKSSDDLEKEEETTTQEETTKENLSDIK